MRDLLVLAVLFLALVVAVVLRLASTEDGTEPPPIPGDDPALGVLTVGLPEGEAGSPPPGSTVAVTADEAPVPEAANTTRAPADEAEAGPQGAVSPHVAPPAGDGDDGEVEAEAKPEAAPEDAGKPANPGREQNPAPAVPAQPPEVRHVVQKGETLYSLVRRFYGTASGALVEAVARANGLADPGRIRPGQELRFPRLPGYPDPREP